ncbi:MAG: class I tRNA ligase family protein [Thermoplasmata archaeon]
MENLNFTEGIDEIWKLIRNLNKYLDEKAPWQVNATNIEETLTTVFYGIRNVLIFIAPFIPETSSKMLEMIGLEKDEAESFKNLEKIYSGRIKIKKREILYFRKK